MDKMLITLISLFLLFLVSSAFALNIPPERITNWTSCGVPSDLTVVSKTIDVKKDYGAIGDGATDDTAAILNAISSATGPCIILFSPGTYLIKKPIIITKDFISLHGVNAEKSKLVFDLNGTNSDCITFEREQSEIFVPVISGFEKGSKEIVVENGAAFLKSNFIEVMQDNDASIMYTRPDWEQVWAKNVMGQLVKIADVKDNVLILEAPLNMSYKKELKVRVRKVDLITSCGVESLYLNRFDGGDANMITFKYAAYGLVKWIESEMVMRSHVSVESSYRCEIRDSYFHHAFDYGGGGHGYGVELKARTTACLVENNRFFHLRHAMMVHLGANGNVFGYNYSKEPFANGDNDPMKTICDISIHGHYAYMNLFESNTIQKIEVSDWWGPSGPNTFLRNKIETEGISVNDKSNGQNFIGNMISEGDYGIESLTGTDPLTILNHGNLEYGEMTWDKTIKSNEIPISLYLKKKPDFLKNTQWPLIGPDCKGKIKLPAELRMNKE